MSQMAVSSNFDFNKVAVGKEGKVNFMVSMTAPKVDIDGKQRPPLNIVAALDISGSMHGQKMDIMKDSVVRMINHLSSKDRIGLVAFDDSVEKISDPVFATSENKEELIRKVTAMGGGGTTNISGAVDMAFEMLGEDYDGRTEDVINRAILFTDGNANVGIRDYAGLVSMVKKRPENISLSTFGYGDDHDEETLSGMAKTGKGNSFYVKVLSDCAEFFGLELGGLLSTFAKNIKLRIIPEAGVKVNRVLNDFAVSVVKEGQEKRIDKVPEKLQVLLDDELHDEVIIDVDDMYGEETRHIVSEIGVPATSIGDNQVLNVRLTYEDVNDKVNESHEFPVNLSFVDESDVPSEADSNVLEQVLLLDSAQAQYDIKMTADRGDTDAARDMIKGFRSRLADAHCYATTDSLQNIGSTLEDLDTEMERSGYSESMSKNIMYCSSSLSRGRTMSKGLRGATFAASANLQSYADNFAADVDDEDKEEEDQK